MKKLVSTECSECAKEKDNTDLERGPLSCMSRHQSFTTAEKTNFAPYRVRSMCRRPKGNILGQQGGFLSLSLSHTHTLRALSTRLFVCLFLAFFHGHLLQLWWRLRKVPDENRLDVLSQGGHKIRHLLGTSKGLSRRKREPVMAG